MKKLSLLMLTLAVVAMADDSRTVVPVPANCTATTGVVHTVLGNKCGYYDEVMTGISRIDPMMIYCARIQINCFAKDGADKATEGESDAR